MTSLSLNFRGPSDPAGKDIRLAALELVVEAFLLEADLVLRQLDTVERRAAS